MAPTDLWSSRVLGPADLGRAMELSAAAGWNQVNADWRVFLELGHLMGVEVTGDGVVGTAATLPLGHDFGWISMMLVAPPFQRRGIGRQLLGACVLDLASQGLLPGLDATPAGRELYREFDFRDGWALTRWKRVGHDAAPAEAAAHAFELRAATASDLDAIAGLDRWAFGCERRSVLARLIERAPRIAAVALGGGVPCGFLLAREGREALLIGTIVAKGVGVVSG